LSTAIGWEDGLLPFRATGGRMSICGVYTITNKINGKVYVGSSADINKRWNYHRRKLSKNSHKNKHLQNAWNKYGKNNFEFRVMEECDRQSQYSVEQKYLDAAEKSPKKYYNQHYKATGSTIRTKLWTQEEYNDLKEYWLNNGTMKLYEYGKQKYKVSQSPLNKLINKYKEETKERPQNPSKFTLSSAQMNELLDYWLMYSSLKTYEFIRDKYGYGSYTAKRLIKEIRQMTDKKPPHPNSYSSHFQALTNSR